MVENELIANAIAKERERGLFECLPPAYTNYVGLQLIESLSQSAESVSKEKVS
jgi:hypothetical protein